MRWIRCPFCGERICVNNYADRKVRLPKLRLKKLDVVMCGWCMGKNEGRGRILALWFKQVTERADAGDEAALRTIRKFMAVPPKRFRE